MPDTSPISLEIFIELSTETDPLKTRERCPVIVFRDDTGVPVARFPTDEEHPCLDLPDASVERIDLGRALSRVIDEEAWLRECRRVLIPGGELRFIVPASGPLSWLDARNIYRYAVDIIGRGAEPDDTLPTGWHRHYSRDDIEHILASAGLVMSSTRRVGTGIPEIPQIAGFIAGNMILGRRDTERRLHPLRVQMEKRDARRPVPFLGSSFQVIARRP